MELLDIHYDSIIESFNKSESSEFQIKLKQMVIGFSIERKLIGGFTEQQ
jgi:hypothetical protein